MTKQPPTTFKVLYYGLARTAAFNCLDDAIAFGRERSRTEGTVEVRDRTGLIGQFESGKATPEFAHIDTAYSIPHEPTTYRDVLESAREGFRTTLDTLRPDDEDDIRAALGDAIQAAVPVFNNQILEILMRDISMGFPDDRSVMREADDVYEAARGSIRESLANDLERDAQAAIDALEDATAA